MHFLITGHTGFKGAWLTVLLNEIGHTVSGIALEPEPGALYEAANLSRLYRHDLRVDIRDAEKTKDALEQVNPEVIVHLAAQPLVRRSYLEPRLTVETNVMGTFNILDAATHCSSLKAMLIATTDKVYRNVGRRAGYAEDEALGGHDPYSASKAMADLLTQSWAHSFDPVPTAIARAGNVIGGGDVSQDRLLVDLVKGFKSAESVDIRYPDAVRPWQHVLDCLNGYLAIIDGLLEQRGAGEWNVGPDERSFIAVGDLANYAARFWGDGARWNDVSNHQHLHEATLLALDASKIQRELGWKDYLPYPLSLDWTLEWEKSVANGTDAFGSTVEQVRSFLEYGK